ncbi:MAG: hypothetical protein RL156_81, partial [Bacteroidota bacterium]
KSVTFVELPDVLPRLLLDFARRPRGDGVSIVELPILHSCLNVAGGYYLRAFVKATL